jgi:hypothetical protein
MCGHKLCYNRTLHATNIMVSVICKITNNVFGKCRLWGQCKSRWWSSGLLHHVTFWLCDSITEEHTASIFSPDDEVTIFLQNLAYSQSAILCNKPANHHLHLENICTPDWSTPFHYYSNRSTKFEWETVCLLDMKKLTSASTFIYWFNNC